MALSAAVLLGVTASCGQVEKVRLHKTVEAVPVTVGVITIGMTCVDANAGYVGRVEPSRSTILLCPFPGRLVEFNAVKGGKVSGGAVIAKVESESLKSAYDIAKSALDQAEDGFARVEKVYGSGSVPEVRMVEIRTKLEQARAAERSARQALEDCSVTVPFSGVIGDVFCQKGEQLSVAAPLVQIMDVESVEIHFSVPEGEYSDISVGTAADIEIPALKKSVSGTVAVKGISASALSHAYDFTIKNISDSRSLMPGMVCKVRVRRKGEAAIVIPASAVLTDMDGRYVWGVTPDGKVCKSHITVGGYSGQGVVVTEGLAEGDRVIIEGSRKVSTGMKVKAEER